MTLENIKTANKLKKKIYSCPEYNQIWTLSLREPKYNLHVCKSLSSAPSHFFFNGL